MSSGHSSAIGKASLQVTVPRLTSAPLVTIHVLDSELHHRVLGWLADVEEPIGNRFYSRATAAGLAAHLTDDPSTNVRVAIRESGEVLSEDGTYTEEIIATLLDDLEKAGLVKVVADKYYRTPEGDEALGGVVYADLPAAEKRSEEHKAFFAKPKATKPAT
jgi:hypothetical protein